MLFLDKFNETQNCYYYKASSRRKQYPNINTDESYHNATREINESKIQKNTINTTNIERYNDHELITEYKVNKNKQGTNIIEKFATINDKEINVIVEPS